MYRLLRKMVVCFAFFWATAVRADPPSLSVPSQITGAPGAFLTVPAATSGKNVRWFALDSGLNLFPSSLLKDTRTAVVCSSSPGTYRLVAMTAAGDELSEPAVCRITIQGEVPAPSPQPSPAPSPQPQPAEKAAWAVAIVDNGHRTPVLGQLLGSVTLFQSLQKNGVTLRILDVGDPLVQANGYSDGVAVAGGAPALLVLSEKGRRLKAIRFPSDEASLLAAVGIAASFSSPCGPNGCPFQPRNQFVFPEVQPK